MSSGGDIGSQFFDSDLFGLDNLLFPDIHETFQKLDVPADSLSLIKEGVAQQKALKIKSVKAKENIVQIMRKFFAYGGRLIRPETRVPKRSQAP